MLLFHLVVDVRCNKPVAFSKREFGVHETDSIDGGYNQSFASVLVDGRDNKAFQSKIELDSHRICRFEESSLKFSLAVTAVHHLTELSMEVHVTQRGIDYSVI